MNEKKWQLITRRVFIGMQAVSYTATYAYLKINCHAVTRGAENVEKNTIAGRMMLKQRGDWQVI